LQTIGLYRIKGGVVKTAACVNLAYLSAADCKKTLRSDLDPQGSATFYFRIHSPEKLTTEIFLKHNNKRNKAIKETDFEFLDLLPAAFFYRRIDLRLNGLKHPKERLKTIYQGKLHNSIIGNYRQSDYGFLETSIPYSSDVEKKGTNRQPLFLDYPNSPAASAYRGLWAR
jgi:cellulose biosynthesis protein BcsQ